MFRAAQVRTLGIDGRFPVVCLCAGVCICLSCHSYVFIVLKFARIRRIANSNLKRHQLTHQHTLNHPHACSICGKQFAQSNNLKVCRRCGSNSEPFIWLSVGRLVCLESVLSMYASIFVDRLITSLCFVMMMHQEHLRSHTQEKPFTCM